MVLISLLKSEEVSAEEQNFFQLSFLACSISYLNCLFKLSSSPWLKLEKRLLPYLLISLFRLESESDHHLGRGLESTTLRLGAWESKAELIATMREEDLSSMSPSILETLFSTSERNFFQLNLSYLFCTEDLKGELW